jgi:hypothetical protein
MSRVIVIALLAIVGFGLCRELMFAFNLCSITLPVVAMLAGVVIGILAYWFVTEE